MFAKTRFLKTIVVVMAFVFMVKFYYTFNPEQYYWFPKCPVYRFTGLECPSCGNQRALHALLHGDVETALRYNLFGVVAFPYAIMLVIASFCTSIRLLKIRKFLLSKTMVSVYVILYLLWGIVRNIL